MPFDPSTLCARTAAGDAELAAPRHGLAIAQRRLLSLLDRPAPLDELAGRPGVMPDRLERDLARLAEHGLVELHAPAAPASPRVRPAARPQPVPLAAPAPAPAPPPRADGPRPWTDAQPGLAASVGSAAPESRVVLGRRVRHGRAIVLGFLTLVGVGAAAWWLATPTRESPAPAPASERSPAPAPAPVRRAEPAPATLPPPLKVVATPESFVTEPATATPPSAIVARPAPAVPVAVAPATAPVIPQASLLRPVPSSVAVAPPAAIAKPDVAMPKTDAPPSGLAAAAPSSPPPVAPASPAPVAPPTPEPAAASSSATVVPTPLPVSAPPTPLPAKAGSPAPATPPIQLAAATPSTLAAKPVPRRLEPVSREEPAFPRDALAHGVTKGTVRARVAIDASGKVTGVEILDAEPRRVFDRAVVRALSRWTYEAGEPSRSAVVEVAFNRD